MPRTLRSSGRRRTTTLYRDPSIEREDSGGSSSSGGEDRASAGSACGSSSDGSSGNEGEPVRRQPARRAASGLHRWSGGNDHRIGKGKRKGKGIGIGKRAPESSSSGEESGAPVTAAPSLRTRRRRRSRGSIGRAGGNAGGDVLAGLPAPRSRGSGARGRTRNKRTLGDTDSESDGADGGATHKGKSNGSKERSCQDDNDNDNDKVSDCSEEQNREAGTPMQTRRSGRKAYGRKTTAVARAARRPVKRKRAVHSSDEEFVLDSDENEDEDESNESLGNDTDEDDGACVEDDIGAIGDADLSEEDDARGALSKAFANIDHDPIGTADDDSDSGNDDNDNDDNDNDDKRPPNHPRPGAAPAAKPTRTEILPSPRRTACVPFGVHSGDSFSDREAEGRSWRRRLSHRCPECPSTEDAITCEALPRVHVCYLAPDGRSRQCFALETLRQIALQSEQLFELRVDVDGERQNFLQPPAFRTTMSDDLVDQIASKFGRGALDLHGEYYRHREKDRHRGGTCNGNGGGGDGDGRGAETIYDSFTAFRDRVKDYFKRGMGSQDIYVCPLCYGQIHRNMVNPPDTKSDGDDGGDDNDKSRREDQNNGNGVNVNDNDNDNDEEATPSESVYDPMTVLGHLDNEELSIASQFCFKKLVDVKRHLREEHGVDTGGLEGNELYKRYKVRAPDGLLQRYLWKQRGRVLHGHMLVYWYQGNSQMFLQLLDLMERVAYENEFDKDDDDDENDDDDTVSEYATKARAFYETFAAAAPRLWSRMSHPFLKSSDENMTDFIAREDDDGAGGFVGEGEGTDERPSALLHRQLMHSMGEDSDENDLVHKLQRKYAESEEDDDSDGTEEELELVDHKDEKEEDKDDSSDSGDADADADTDNHYRGYYSPIEEEKDEWMLERQSQRKRRPSPPAAGGLGSTDGRTKTPSRKRLVRRKPATPSVAAAGPPSSGRKRALRIQESSSEDDDDDDDSL
ncbi:unnamed protein product [Pseudo-nitzschia multistriata]|uniref:Uncharacterized protein n=1 Tax=Pseudo-nitzschia multistriata TaxID=183589 RepID=A0A448Z9Q0_9STRA|nr:unnamed protein product [Pseudo-nitzschia multistriata]